LNEPSLLPGFNILVEGPAGTGKTHSIGTLVDAGVETYVLFTENGLETLLGYWTDRHLAVPGNLHWHVLPRSAITFDVLAAAATNVNSLALDMLAKQQDINRGKHNQFVDLLKALNNFPDDRSGTSHGPVTDWGPDRALVIDSLSGVNPIALSLVVGGKPVKSQSDWGIAMDQIEKLIRMLTDGCRCHFILTAHIERETDQVLGGSKITVATLGSKLAPKLPPMFSDVVLAEKKGPGQYNWCTAHAQADLKCRNLPDSPTIKPDFAQILTKWQSRGGRLTPNVAK